MSVGKIEEPDTKMLGSEFAAKLFKLYQLAIEYDTYVLNSADDIGRRYKNEYSEAQAHFKILEEEAKENAAYINRLDREKIIKEKALERFKTEVERRRVKLPDSIL